MSEDIITKKDKEVFTNTPPIDEEKNEHGTMFSQRIMERIMDKGYDKTVPNMPYLMALMGQKATGKSAN